MHDAVIAQVLERHEVLILSEPIEESAAKRERAKVAVDDAEELLRLGKTEGDVPDVVVLHVVTALEVLADVPAMPGIDEARSASEARRSGKRTGLELAPSGM